MCAKEARTIERNSWPLQTLFFGSLPCLGPEPKPLEDNVSRTIDFSGLRIRPECLATLTLVLFILLLSNRDGKQPFTCLRINHLQITTKPLILLIVKEDSFHSPSPLKSRIPSPAVEAARRSRDPPSFPPPWKQVSSGKSSSSSTRHLNLLGNERPDSQTAGLCSCYKALLESINPSVPEEGGLLLSVPPQSRFPLLSAPLAKEAATLRPVGAASHP